MFFIRKAQLSHCELGSVTHGEPLHWTLRAPDAGSTPVRQLMMVVLPAPLGPSRQNSCPRSMANQAPLIAQKSRASGASRRAARQLRGFRNLLRS